LHCLKAQRAGNSSAQPNGLDIVPIQFPRPEARGDYSGAFVPHAAPQFIDAFIVALQATSICATQKTSPLSCVLVWRLLRMCRVKRMKAIIALFMLALWVPTTSHALLESVGLIHQEQPASDAHDDHEHDAADGICAITSNSTPLAKGAFLTAVLYVVALTALDASFDSTVTQELSVNGLGPSPPLLLPPSWQFLYRTALPCRAPSIAS
jgi:hypothetical protein